MRRRWPPLPVQQHRERSFPRMAFAEAAERHERGALRQPVVTGEHDVEPVVENRLARRGSDRQNSRPETSELPGEDEFRPVLDLNAAEGRGLPAVKQAISEPVQRGAPGRMIAPANRRQDPCQNLDRRRLVGREESCRVKADDASPVDRKTLGFAPFGEAGGDAPVGRIAAASMPGDGCENGFAVVAGRHPRLPEANSSEAKVAIARIVGRRHAALRHHPLQPLPGNVEKRAKKMKAGGEIADHPHSGKAAVAGAAGGGEEMGLDLVVPVMRRHHGRRTEIAGGFGQKRVAGDPRLALHIGSRLRPIPAPGLMRQPETSRDGTEGFGLACGCGPEGVVDRDDVEGVAEARQISRAVRDGQEKRQRVSAAGNRKDDPPRRGRHHRLGGKAAQRVAETAEGFVPAETASRFQPRIR